MIPILNIEQFDKVIHSHDVYSNELSLHLKKNSHIVHTAHRHDFFLCVLFTKGIGIHEIDFNNFDIQPGTVFFLKPGQTHLWKFDSPPEGFIFFHTSDFFEFGYSNTKVAQFPFYYSNENPPNLHLKKDDLPSIKQLFKEINDEYNTDAIFKNQKLSALINLLYIDLTRLYSNFESHSNVGSTVYLSTLRKFEVLIQKKYKENKSVSFYAKELNISTKHLNRITKNTIGKSPSQIIKERLILEAKRLLVHSEDSLKEISNILGFEDYAYFSKVFKMTTNKTPSVFREKYKKQH